MRNVFVESFKGRMRDECLNEQLFDRLRNARNLMAAWRNDFDAQIQALLARDVDVPPQFADLKVCRLLGIEVVKRNGSFFLINT